MIPKTSSRPLTVWFAALLSLTLAVVALPAASAQGTPAVAVSSCAETLGIGTEDDACVQVIHTSPDAPAVDVYVDGALALENLAFGEASGWVALPAGDHQVQVAATGEAAETAVIDATLTLEAGVAYEVAAVGLLADIAPQVFVADVTPLPAGSARIQVVHTSPDAPAVDVAITGGDVLIENLAFPTASGYLEVPAGTYDLEVRPTGTEDVALALPGVEFEEGMAYDVYAIGHVSDGSLTVLVVASSVGTADATPAS